jgi:HEAT repeat protein
LYIGQADNLVITIEQITAVLKAEEPDYTEAAKLGPDTLPHLDTLVKTADPLLASKAAYLASLIKHEKSIEVLKSAAQSNHPEVRIAAASGSKNIEPNKINEVLSLLKNDEDVGVRQQVTKLSKLATRED